MTIHRDEDLKVSVGIDDGRLDWAVGSLCDDLDIERLTDARWSTRVLVPAAALRRQSRNRPHRGMQGEIAIDHPGFVDGIALRIRPADRWDPFETQKDEVVEGRMFDTIAFPRRRRPVEPWEAPVRMCVWTSSVVTALAATSTADLVLGTNSITLRWTFDASVVEHVGRLRAEMPSPILHVVSLASVSADAITRSILAIRRLADDAGEKVYVLPGPVVGPAWSPLRDRIRREREVFAALRGMAVTTPDRFAVRRSGLNPADLDPALCPFGDES